MAIFKKVLSILISSAILAASSVMAFAASEEKKDGAKAAQTEAQTVVSTLGILSGMPSGESFGITRAEFVSAVLRFSKTDVGEYEVTQFCDVVPGSVQSNEIMTAYEAGIVKGAGGGLFNPSSKITYQEAVTMIVRAMGYGEMAKMKYQNAANSEALYGKYLGIYSGDTNAAVTFDGAAKIFFNALKLGYVDAAGVAQSGNIIYEVGDKTYMKYAFDLERKTGIVTDTEYYMSLSGSGGEGLIEIDGVLYNADIKNDYSAEDIMGKRVYYYVSGDKNDCVVEIVGEITERNKTVEVISEDFISGSTEQIRYYDKNDKAQTARLSRDAIIYYNGAAATNITNEDFDVEDGRLVLIDNNNDNVFDYVFIKNYKRYVVGNSSYGIITSYYDDWRFSTKENPDWKLYNDGVEITSDHLSQWDEIKVMESKDKKTGIIEASKFTYEGEVTKIREKDGKTYVTVDNLYQGVREFELEDIYVRAYQSNRTGAPKPTKGVSYTFLYNSDGRIYGASAVNSQKYEYGFLIKTATEGGLDKTYQCKIFGEFGSMKVYDLADNFKVNGAKVSGSAIMTALSENDNNGQMIMFRKNTAGELAEILTYEDLTQNGTTYGTDENVFSLDAQATAGNWTGTDWRYDVTVNGKIYRIPPTSEVPFFYIPADRTDDEAYRYYSLQSSASIINTAKNYATTDRCEIFDTIRYDDAIDFSKISVITVYAAAKELSPVNPYTISSVNSGSGQVGALCVVRGLEQVVDQFGDVRWQLSYTPVSETKIYTAYFADKVYNVDTTSMFGFGDVEASELEEGMVIFFNYANPYATLPLIDKFYVAAGPALYEKLDYIRMNYERGEYDMPVSHKSNYWAYGNVLYYDDDELEVMSYDDFWITGGGERVICFRTATEQVWQYNISTGEILKSNMAAITRGDRLCIKGGGDVSNATVIIRIVEE